MVFMFMRIKGFSCGTSFNGISRKTTMLNLIPDKDLSDFIKFFGLQKNSNKEQWKQMNITHKQHYVQQQYLSSWEHEHQLWVYDKIYKKSEQKGKKAICYEIDYYKMQRLTDDEKRIFYCHQ